MDINKNRDNHNSSLDYNNTNLLNKPSITEKTTLEPILNSSENKKSSYEKNSATVLTNKTNKQRAINTLEDKTAKLRETVGGKGATLYRMQQAGVRVPEFTTIDVNSIASLEQYVLDIDNIKPFIADIDIFELTEINITNIKLAIQNHYAEQPDKRNFYLKALADFIGSDAFYQQISSSQTTTIIREKYNQLINNLPDSSAIIVRSSGIKEDNYGDAQAGKFESIVHGKQDILQTCLQVLASGFQPHVCPFAAPQPMALILQRCIDCSFGGVAMSRLSLGDSRCKIEFVPGQPKGGVSGLAGVTPHCYLVSQQDGKLTAEFTEGNVTTKFTLKCQDNNNFTEQPIAINSSSVNLTETQLQQIQDYIKLGENLLLCPADIEFAIDQDGNVYIVQLRPLTVLTGGLNFATEPPTDFIATGTLVSEGFRSGKLFYVRNQQDAAIIPQGAIVVAEHGEDWMLENSFLQKVGGFIFHNGGTNDHVAITLRQHEKPCLIVKDNFEDLKNSDEVVTIACCSFNNIEGAYIVHGNDFATKLNNMQSVITANYQPRSSSAPKKTTPKLSFNSPDIAFKNLNDLNYRLLEYFNADSWLTRCFSEKCILSLSMMPYRVEIIKEAEQEIQQMFADFELFLTGYKQYLQLGIKPETDNHELQQKLVEAEQLTAKFNIIKTQVSNHIDNILQQFIASNEQTINKTNFNQLLQSATAIFSNMQQLNIPKTIDDINSIHDCIFWMHKEFIDALALVAINSGLGTITEHEQVISIIFSALKEQQAIEKICVDSLNTLTTDKQKLSKLVIMDNAIIATAQLGVHACTIEMLEQAEAGKERTLKLKLSDDFKTTVNYQGKLKRFWFLVQLLYNLDFAKNALEIKASVEESTGILLIEIPHIKTKDIMLDKFLKLIILLDSLQNIDLQINSLITNKENILWSFSILKYRIANIASLENQQYFNYFVVILGCIVDDIDKFAYINGENFYPLLQLIKTLRTKKETNSAEIQSLLNNIDQINQENLVFGLLSANVTSIIKFAKEKYPNWFTDKQTMIKLVTNNGMLLKEASSELQEDRDVVLTAGTENVQALEYASAKLTSNTEFILNFAININAKAVTYANNEVRQDENILLTIIENNFLAFDYIADELKQNKTFLLKAITINPYTYLLMDASFLRDQEISDTYKQAIKK